MFFPETVFYVVWNKWRKGSDFNYSLTNFKVCLKQFLWLTIAALGLS